MAISFLLLITAGCQRHHQPKSKRPDNMVELTVNAIALPTGQADSKPAWGYEIFAGDSLYVRQIRVPAVTGKFGFASPEDAKKVAGMVIKKLQKGLTPTLSLQDIKDADVQLTAL